MRISIYIIIFTVAFYTSADCQTNSEPRSDGMLWDAQHSLTSFNLKEGSINYHPEQAIVNLKRVKRIFFYKPNIVKQANASLSECELLQKDTIQAILYLKHIIGLSRCRRIECNRLSSISKTKRNDYHSYNATKKLIKIYIELDELVFAKRYFIYLKDKVRATWYCGNGSWQHKKFIESVEKQLQ